MAVQQLSIKIKSIAPILLHNGQLCDPSNPFVKALQAATSANKGKNKTDAKTADIAKLEWRGSLYVNQQGRLVLPAELLDAAILGGAKKSKNGMQFKAGAFVTDDAELRIPTQYNEVDELYEHEQHRDSRAVKVGQARIMRMRPRFNDWSCEFTLCYNEDVVTEDKILSAVNDAGSMVGLGDFRPRFGRFELYRSLHER